MWNRVVRAAMLILLSGPALLSAQTLETETARLLKGGSFKLAGNFEWQTSSEGREIATPLAFEWGIHDRWELLVEPVPYTSIRPRSGRHATGAGDLEITLTTLLHKETRRSPALALAGEVKLPTARDTLIGTRRTDFAAYLIGSKRFGRLDLHANLGYTIKGAPAGIHLNSVFNAAFAGTLSLGPRNELFAEVLANSSPLTGPATGNGAESSTTPELAGGEVVGTLGVGRYLWPSAKFTLGVSYDNNAAVMLRPGFVLRLK